MNPHDFALDDRGPGALRPSPVATLALALALTSVAGCGRSTAHVGPPPDVKEYRLEGTVRDVKKESGQVVIHHKDIVGFMPAMTMPFALKDRSLFDDLRPGDEVEGKLRVEYEGGEVRDYELLDLVVSKPAPPPAPAPTLRLNLSGGEPSLELVPKRLEPGEPVPDFAMTTQDGEPLRLSALRGKVVVLTFVYTRCPLPEFCPAMDRKFAGLADALGAVPARAKDVRLISLSFDPEHDTPEVLSKHARTQGARPPLWTFAVARHEELARVAPALGLTYGPTSNEIVHNLSTAVIDPDGKLAALLVGDASRSWTNAELIKIIAGLAPKTGETP